MPPFKMIELFAGIGGIRLGFDRAFGKGVETVFVSEIDNYAKINYENFFKDDFKIEDDIRDIDEKKFPRLPLKNVSEMTLTTKI